MKEYTEESFENFLARMHGEVEPMVLDDDLSDAFSDWLGDMGPDLMIAYAGKWHVEQLLASLNGK